MEKKEYTAPEVVEYGPLQEVVLNTCGRKDADTTSIDGGDDSYKASADEL